MPTKFNSEHPGDIDLLLSRAAQTEKLKPELYQRIETRVLRQQLPPQNISWLDALVNWLSPQPQARLRPLLVASCPLILGVVIGNFYDFGITNTPSSEMNFDSWDDEFLMLSFNELDSLDDNTFDGGFDL